MRCGVTALGSSSLRSECRYGQSRHTAFALGALHKLCRCAQSPYFDSTSWRENSKHTKIAVDGARPRNP